MYMEKDLNREKMWIENEDVHGENRYVWRKEI